VTDGPVPQDPAPTDPAVSGRGFGSPLLEAVREIERYAAEQGWDQPARLFALAPTAELLEREPALVAALGIDPGTAAELTPIEQEELSAERPLEQVLAQLAWPEGVVGCALVVERLVLPPHAEAELAEDPATLQEKAATHAERQEVRMVVGVLRDGSRECAIRLRAHDDEHEVLSGPDLVPSLADALLATLV
jgi:hypothetical protein